MCFRNEDKDLARALHLLRMHILYACKKNFRDPTHPLCIAWTPYHTERPQSYRLMRECNSLAQKMPIVSLSLCIYIYIYTQHAWTCTYMYIFVMCFMLTSKHRGTMTRRSLGFETAERKRGFIAVSNGLA